VGYAPLIASIMGLSALCSLSSMIGMYAPTSDLSTLLGWSLMVFVLITYNKFRAGGPLGYIKGYFQPIPVLLPFNIISEFATPLSMAFRHFGNIASGSVITALIYAALAALSHAVFSLLPGALGSIMGQIPLLQVGIPAIFSIYFDLFSSCLQAFIFCMLTMMYIGSAAEG
jgi:F0F1-type ATP synthase, subunit a